MSQPSIRAKASRLFNPLRMGFIALALAALAAGCSTNQAPGPQVLQDLCAKNDLSNTKQRTLLAGGYHAIEKNDLVCAERLTAEARRVDPKDPYAALNLGAIYQRTGRIEMARGEYYKTIALEEGDGRHSEKSEGATIATIDQAKNKTPGEIAKRNLERLRK
jgi:thioredoxin-like negative regulator of GroEL